MPGGPGKRGHAERAERLQQAAPVRQRGGSSGIGREGTTRHRCECNAIAPPATRYRIATPHGSSPTGISAIFW